MDIVATNSQRIINERGMKQKYVAQQMGLSANQLSAMFYGRKKVDSTTVLKFCKVLNTTPNALYGYEE